ncbi:3'(2'),5'-bisphosphate nucleotidase CysQ [Bowmanella yangjiangensis]|uniref:3'(2'),5'-bisphosphate nucleotidase CysQ n=1 Tax=Bowmanella yangjiangensis TaxID=2811230 RepID=A0ABS3CPD7_9ALTE|nr:3'(2'),5'-bisphosphate nucleotidase CysQ [Bowmanella yangjiangensis]MBN7818978.1 3'(2'),5'-bisphosphate nucleotidase CysQ [Bowmanella yangjiangensis]
MSDTLALAEQVSRIARAAGSAILTIYQQDFAIYDKADKSPLTEADLAAHHIIVAGLKEISDLPILSEESATIAWAERRDWQRYWLVDPLDGTKEFIKKNGEFTVNIALIENGHPVLGVVYAPVLDTLYVGVVGEQAYKENQGQRTALKPAFHQPGDEWKIVGSRSHQSPEIEAFLAQLDGDKELLAMGSSLKLCLVAEGRAHLYPRLGPTSEWDTAAAHAVVLAAGGNVTELAVGQRIHEATKPLVYNQKESLLNPFFLVSAHASGQ